MSYKVIGIGEVLWDLLPTGPQLGGAPTNFAYHAHSLGAQAQVISRVGNDSFGQEIFERFGRMRLPDQLVQHDDSSPTGTVTVTLNGDGIPHFIIHENVAWDRIEVTKSALATVRAADAICFGSLAQRSPASRSSIQRLLAAAPANSLRVFDVNLRQNFYSRELLEQSLRLANVLKLNDTELQILAEMFTLGKTDKQQMESLSKNFGLRVVVLTRGGAGSLIYQQGRWSEQKTEPVSVVDTIGAGDSFTAAVVMGLLNEGDLDEVHAFAAQVARYVCSCAGATPPLPNPLREHFIPVTARRQMATAIGESIRA